MGIFSATRSPKERILKLEDRISGSSRRRWNIVECPEPQAEAAAKLLEEEMEQVAHLSVPLTAEAHWGRNWLEAKG